MRVDKVISRLIEGGCCITTFEAPAGYGDYVTIEWHIKGTMVGCRLNHDCDIDLYGPDSMERLEAAYLHCMAHQSCRGCKLFHDRLR